MTMARISTVIAVILVTLTSMAQGVVDTPFWEGTDSVITYVKTIGYTENWRMLKDTLPALKKPRIRYFADNTNDGSTVMVEEWRPICGLNYLIEVRYTWQNKKMMPKGLPKEQQVMRGDGYDKAVLTYGKYKNHYFMSTCGNRITGPRGVSYLEGDCGGGGHHHHHHGGGHHHRR